MRLQNIYRSDIDRNINGVIKVAQNDEVSIEQELREYIITKELRRHFNTFFDNYESSLSRPTDKIGVWISGFFGSGKSHFLKMLSYLLENPVIAGKAAVDYFADKFDDPMRFAQIETCAKVPTKSILFNIDNKAPIKKDKTVILRTFAKVFYEKIGYYGDDLKVAKFEQYLDRTGKAQAFKDSFRDINGGEWEESRDAFGLIEDDIVDALVEGLGMTETSARNWFNGTEDTEISIEGLVRDIKEYIDSLGKSQRLLFMIDEIGQYIGSDSDLMLNLQTIVEEIGTRCEGRVWVMVTSQEAIDHITKISGDDFSKIQGRFNTRLSLSSSSVDEVIKKRILAKNEDGENLLKMVYEKNHSGMKNLFSFNNAILDLKGFSGEGEFIETYPFVPYQFRLMQNVLAQIRKHGNSGKHLSGGERSMLSGFQEAAQAIEDKNERALVPFCIFYDTIHTFLESTIRRVIDRCKDAADNNDGIEQYDVSVLKLLYLIRYVDDVKSNIDNITTLMVDEIDADKINIRKAVAQSLDRLVSQNYVSRNGDTYTFLTDDEQDIAREIKKTPVDSFEITTRISQIIFNDIYQVRKYRYGKCDFPFDRIVDETPMGQLTGAVHLHMITMASDIYDQHDDSNYRMKSGTENEAMIVLSDELPYFEEIENAMKIRKFVKGKNIAQLPEAIQTIIRERQEQASAYEKRAAKYIADAIAGGKAYIAGELFNVKGSNAVDKLNNSMSALIENVYTKLSFVNKNFDSDEQLLAIAADSDSQIRIEGTDAPNSEAMTELLQYLEMQKLKNLPTSMSDIQRRYSAIPYGWREIDIAAITLQLIADGKLTAKHSGDTVRTDDRKIADYLRKRTETEKTVISLRVVIDPKLIKKARDILSEYYDINAMDVPSEEDKLAGYVIECFENDKKMLSDMINNDYTKANYPGKNQVTDSITLCDKVLSQKKDNEALFKKIISMEDELLDNAEDMAEVKSFFKVQRSVFDSALKLVRDMGEEKDYIRNEQSMSSSIKTIMDILALTKPYRRISELPALMQEVRSKYEGLLADKCSEVDADISSAMGDIHQTADIKQEAIVKRADDELTQKRQAAKECVKLTTLDAMKIQIANIRQRYIKQLAAEEDQKTDTVTIGRGTLLHTVKLKNEADIDKYLAEVKEQLMEKLDGHEQLHII